MTQEKQTNHSNWIKFVDARQKKEIGKKVDAHKLFEKLQIEISKDRPGQIRGCCPIHGGDNNTAFSMDFDMSGMEAPVWMCRTRCGTSGDVFELIQRVYKIDFLTAVNWVADFVGITSIGISKTTENPDFLHEEDVSAFKKQMGARGITVYNKSGYTCPDINDAFVNKCMLNRNDYFKNRGFTDEELDFYKVGFCKARVSEWKEDRVVVPFWDKEGTLVGISGRTLYDTKNNKYKILMGSRKGDNLYGLNWALPHIMEKGSVILVEGFVDVWRCKQHGKHNVVAVMGKDLTTPQKLLLLSIANTVVVAFDGDPVGRMQSENVVLKIKDFVTTYQMIPKDDKDLGDLDRENFYKLCLSAIKRS